MPAKYSHVKKRAAKKSPGKAAHKPDPHVDRSISQAMTAVSQLERAIARILLIRYEQDIARLFSTRLYTVALTHLPTFVMRCVALAGPGWVAHNSDADEIKDFFRSAISMDMRQAGERVATKSVLWSYTALRHFAISNNIVICNTRGLHSLRLLPHYDALKTHLDALEAMPAPAFAKPPHLGSLEDGQAALEEACSRKYAAKAQPPWPPDWRDQVRIGYERVSQTLWRVACEFDVRGYGLVLREKLTSKWCDCGCSTDHLGEVCERTVRTDEAESGVRQGKQREWDGRGSGVYGWETEEEEDIWEIGLDFGAMDPEDPEGDGGIESEMTIGELMEWRYIKAEREKEKGNVAFRKGDFVLAVKHYQAAFEIEPELPHYQLNLAAAHLKLSNWMEAESACTRALSQHRSGKGYFRRARARTMLGRADEAIRDLRALLKLQPSNTEGMQELAALLPPPSPSSEQPATSSSSHDSGVALAELHARLGLPRPKSPKVPPFARTQMDARRLKLVLVPAPPPAPPPCSHRHHVCARHQHEADHHHCEHRHADGGSGKGKGKGRGGISVDGASPREKEGILEAEMRRMLEAMGGSSAGVPSWERYVVKRVD
ncbi:hypothetical protein FB45DRAFT_730401 [Roridomyces roridus]|uniref:Uncharacterized protein n=1 Tax=Roridomyces roridus TaxID=1738132 RepID=A0AAD7CK87_9AGAR|nr:hypothetical protein FB45DRAFT_730401 [Roridomyces roridus]